MSSSSEKKKPRRRIAGEKKRLNFKMDKELVDWASGYAERHNTTMTQLITNHFMALRIREAVARAQDAEQV
jgi:hypothetical protein